MAKYQPPFDPNFLDAVNGIHASSENANASYNNGDPRIGQKGSIPPAEVFEHFQREIIAAIAGAGLTPTHTDLTQLWQVFQVVVASNASAQGVSIYEQFAAAKHRFRDLIPGDNISLQLVETATAGRYGIRINVSNVAGSGSGSQGSSGGAAGDVIRPCLVGITGDLTNLVSCGAAIASTVRGSGYEAAKSFDDSLSTAWEPTPSEVATSNWVGWDFDPSNTGYFATVNKVTLRQRFNSTNQNDIWRAAVVEASEDLSTWVQVATLAGLVHPAADATGPVEAVTFSPYSARAFRVRGTAVDRYTSAAALIQVPLLLEVEFIKTA